MVDFFKSLYEAIINIFKGEVNGNTQEGNIFNTIKKMFDDFFAGLNNKE